jgi:putative FmdB family regulatory protein
MPIYSYKCKACGEVFDLLVGVTADAEKLRCVKCGNENLLRLFSGFGIAKGGSKSSSTCTTPT